MQRRLVELLTAEGVSQLEIGRVIAIDGKTLRKHYRRELNIGAAKLESALVDHLLRIACGRDGTAFRARRAWLGIVRRVFAFSRCGLAEEVGFEPTVRFPARRFSRPVP